MTIFQVGDKVKTDIGSGTITKIRVDSNSREIYDVRLDHFLMGVIYDSLTINDRMVVARREELTRA